MALTATERYCEEDIINDGNGTFTAKAGINAVKCDNDPTTPGAKWNFGLFFTIDTLGISFEDFAAQLSNDNIPFDVLFNYDTDPSSNNSSGQLSVWQWALAANPTGNVFQTSQNLHFDWLDNPSFVSPPSINFDPLAAGIYDLGMSAFTRVEDDAGNQNALVVSLANVSIDVNVEANQVSEPGLLALFLLNCCFFFKTFISQVDRQTDRDRKTETETQRQQRATRTHQLAVSN